jgi:hypothetical protein
MVYSNKINKPPKTRNECFFKTRTQGDFTQCVCVSVKFLSCAGVAGPLTWRDSGPVDICHITMKMND